MLLSIQFHLIITDLFSKFYGEIELKFLLLLEINYIFIEENYYVVIFIHKLKRKLCFLTNKSVKKICLVKLKMHIK